MDGRVVAFIGISTTLGVVLGPDMVLIAKNTIVHGRRFGFNTAAGTMVGILVPAVAALLGLSAIVASSATTFTVMKFVGAAYLIFLGLHASASPEPRCRANPFQRHPSTTSKRGHGHRFCQCRVSE